MKIKSITLFNIGSYVDMNTFQFSISKDRNIVLIGGKNGAGKTTFFKAIKTCLYGCRVWGFDAPGKDYYAIINGLINSKSLYDNSAKAYIEIELYFNDGKQTNIYTLHREWKKTKMTFTEYFQIKKNGDLIIGEEEDDFFNYLLSVIPPDMFNFYFFDGEAIAEFFLGDDGNKNFRNAFLKLYGLDTLSIMIENFNRSIKKTDIQNSSYALFLEARDLCDKEEEKYNALQLEIAEVENKIDLCQIKLRSLQVDYSKEGGISLAEWKALNSDLLKEENNRENLNRWLKEVANHYLPFIILEKQLINLQIELSAAQDAQKNAIMLDTVVGNGFQTSIDAFLKEKGSVNINSLEFIEFLKDMLLSSEKGLDYDFSINQISRIFSQIYDKQEFDSTQISKAITQLNSSLKKSKKIRSQLALSTVDGYENFMEEKEDLVKTISSLSIDLERKRQECEFQKNICGESSRALEKARGAYEGVLKNKSISDISERSAATFSLVEEKLVSRQAELLRQEFIKCFTSIINKNNFIDGIIIDKRINVIPYKYITVTKGQLENYKSANNDFLALFNNVQYYHEISRLMVESVDSIRLPSPIRAPFSQGERQIYIMSLYLALLKTSHKDIPFFVDTPFARIDSNHRSKIIQEFFTKISNQMFVLSTDEEIVGKYKLMMDKRISNTFVLQINDYGTTKIAAEKYFGE